MPTLPTTLPFTLGPGASGAAIAVSLSETVSTTDTLARQISLLRNQVESNATSATVGRTVAELKSISESNPTTDTMSRTVATAIQLATEGSLTTDAVSRLDAAARAYTRSRGTRSPAGGAGELTLTRSAAGAVFCRPARLKPAPPPSAKYCL
jgi:hypothetical protein